MRGVFDHVEIISKEEIQYESGVKVIVSAAYDFENIKKGLLNKFVEDDIISLDEMLNLTF